EFKEDYYWELLEDPYTEIFNVLKKHTNTLNHFDINLHYEYSITDYYDIYDDFDYTFLQYALLEFHNLKILEINSPIFLNNDNFNKKLEMVAYRNLEILKIDFIDIYQVNCMVKNSLCLRELRINEFHWNDDDDNFYNDSLNFIRTICENCYLIEYLTIPVFPSSENHFIEFEKLLKKCQKLRSLNFKEAYYEAGRDLEFEDYLLNVLIREASANLREIRIPYDIMLSLKTLETFLEKWKGRPATRKLEYQEFLPDDDLLQREENKKTKNLGGRPKSLVWGTYAKQGEQVSDGDDLIEVIDVDYESDDIEARIFDEEDDFIISRELNLDANAFIKDLDEIIEDCDNIDMEEENIQDIVISENESSIEWDPDIEADKIIDDM
ncbi:20052_t:CDS:2, partial [Rhizophagus irregularis]